jgi:hypothetical protein
MSLRALDITVFMVLMSLVIIYVPPVAAPQWAGSINLGPMSALNTYNDYSLEMLASSWAAFSGSASSTGLSWTTIVDFALLSLTMILEALMIAATLLVGSIGIFFAIQATFPQIPAVIFIIVGSVVYIIYGWAWFQILSGRPGEVLT